MVFTACGIPRNYPEAWSAEASLENHSDDKKKQLRESLLSKRKNNSYSEGGHSSIVRAIKKWLLARKDITEVCLFSSIRNEPDILGLADNVALGCKFFLPRVEGEGCMNFYTFEKSDLLPGAFGIPEPDPDKGRCLRPGVSTLILVPAVAVDRRGFRLGYGGGYYDRYLDKFRRQNPLTMGVVWEEFYLKQDLPHADWDKQMKLIVTETGIRKTVTGRKRH